MSAGVGHRPAGRRELPDAAEPQPLVHPDRVRRIRLGEQDDVRPRPPGRPRARRGR